MKKTIFLIIIFLLNILDLYFKYSLKEIYHHNISHKIIFLPFLLILFLFLVIISKEERKKLLFYLILILTASFSNLVDLIINKGAIINYINLYFFYNNISDITIFSVLLFIIFDLNKDFIYNIYHKIRHS